MPRQMWDAELGVQRFGRSILGVRYRTRPVRIQARTSHTTLEATQGQILNQPPTDATRFLWHLYGS